MARACLIWFIAASAFACDQKQIADAVCWAACKRDDYDGGYSKGRQCVCTRVEEMSELIEAPIILPPPPKPSKLPITIYRYRDDDL